MSGNVISRMRASVDQLQGGNILNNSSVDDIPALLINKESSKTYNKPDLQAHVNHGVQKTKQKIVQAKPSTAVDDGCVFSRLKSWKSTDVKVSKEVRHDL